MYKQAHQRKDLKNKATRILLGSICSCIASFMFVFWIKPTYRSSISFQYFLIFMQHYNSWNKLVFSTVRSTIATYRSSISFPHFFVHMQYITAIEINLFLMQFDHFSMWKIISGSKRFQKFSEKNCTTFSNLPLENILGVLKRNTLVDWK